MKDPVLRSSRRDSELTTTPRGLTTNIGNDKMRFPLFICIILISLLGFAAISVQTAGALEQQPGNASLIIKLVDGLSADEQAAVIARNGGTEISSIPALRLHIIEIPSDKTPGILIKYQSDPQVQRAEMNKKRKVEKYKGNGTPNDHLYLYQWSLQKIGWDKVYSSVVPLGSATVAILDTGVDALHPDLKENIVPGTSVIDGTEGMSDPDGHGTWLAGIVAAKTNNKTGVAGVGFSGVRIMPVTVLGSDGTGQDSDIIAGIMYAVEHGAHVILMGFSNPDFSEHLHEAIEYAWSMNVVMVAATGNDALTSPTFPAGDRGVIGVSATDSFDILAPFSNYGEDVFLAAPGTDIVTTDINEGYTSIIGTSASAAIVAGVAAFMKAVDPNLTNGVIAGRLARTAEPVGTEEETGYGRVNMSRAVTDTSVEPIEPAGAPGGSGTVGPYEAAANCGPGTTCTSVASANWSVAGTWDCNCTPVASTIVIIAAGNTVAMNGNPGACNSLTINGTANWAQGRTTNVGTGGITIASTGNITGTANGVLTTTGNLTVNATTTSTTVTVTMQTTGGQTISGTGSLGRLAVNSTTTNNGNLTVTTALTGSSTLTNGTNATLKIGGTSAITGLTATAAGNTVEYNGAVAQTVKATAYTNLIFSGSGAKAMATGTSVSGNLSIAPTGTATASVGTGLNLGVNNLTLGGLGRISGTWGSTSSSATNKNDTYFAATTGYLTVAADTRTTPTITWSNPADITYGTALSVTQLNATASVPGTFVYTPASGTVLNAGNGQTLSVNFTPTDTTSYNNASQNVTINVIKAAATVTLGSLSHIYDGTQKSATATTSPVGLTVSFTYNGSATPPTNAGSYTVVGTINDTNYQGSATDTMTIGKATPTITWSNPADITYGTALSGTQLNATASVLGSFVYTPPAGTVLNAGNGQTLHVDFTPSDTINYNTASANVTINVLKANQTITVTTPAPANAAYNTSFAVTATASSGLTVTYSSGSPLICSNVGSVFTMISGTGTCIVQYDQAGNANYNAATQVTENTTAQKANQTITVGTPAPANAAYNSTFNVAATASSNLPVAITTTGVCSGSGSGSATITMTSGTGTCTVHYNQTGDSNYEAALEVTETTNAEPGPLDHFAISVISGPQTVGTPFNITITAQDAGNNTVTAFTGTVDLSTTAGTISPTVSGSFTAGVWTDNVMVTGSGTGKTITATKTAGTETGTSNTFDVNPGDAVAFTVSVPSSAIAGTAIDVAVTARDVYNNVATGYTGTVHFTSDDSQAVLPIDYTFQAGDNGSKTFTAEVTLKTSGTRTVTATDTLTPSITGTSGSISVGAASVTKLSVSAPAVATAGTAFDITVTAQDTYGNTVTGYTGSAQFISTDSQATLPANYTFQPVDNGSRIFTAETTLKTAGSQTVTTTDIGTPSVNGTSGSIAVNAGALDYIIISPASATIAAGDSQSYTAAAYDSYNNSLGDVTGSTAFSITPDGSCTGNSCSATIAGVHTVTGSYSSKTATSSLNVNVGTLDHIIITPASATIAAGDSQSYTAAAYDSHNNNLGDVTGSTTFSITPDGTCTGSSCSATIPGAHTVTGSYSGKTATSSLTVNAGALDHITISPASATIAAGDSQSYTAAAYDAYTNSLGDVTGSTTFSITPDGSCTGSSCSATITGAHTVTGSYSGKTATSILTVNPATATTLTVTALSSAATGVPFDIAVTAKDAYGNIATAYLGTVHFTSTDGSATLPSDYTFVGGDNGSHAFTGGVTFTTAGTQTVAATDTVTPSVTGTSADISVSGACFVTAWSKTFDGGSFDYARGITSDSAGNVYVTGWTSDGMDYDFAIIKYDSSGTVVWSKKYATAMSDYASGIAVDGSGNVYVTGYSYIGTSYDFVTIKFDSSGEVVWNKSYDDGKDNYARAIAVDSSGNVYVTGDSYNGLIHTPEYDYLTVKYDSLGTVVWAKTYNAGSIDLARGIAVDGSNVYVTGYSYNGSNYDFVTIKYDSNDGTLLPWSATYNSGQDDYARAIAVDSSGNIYVTGEAFNGSNNDFMTVKYDSSGNELWTRSFDGGYDDVAYGITVDASGNVYVTGESFNGTNNDFMTIKYDQNGTMLSSWIFDSGDEDGARGITTHGSDVYVTGTYYPGTSGALTDFMTIKYQQFCDPFRITTPVLRWATTGVSYTQSLSAVSGVTPYTWSVTSGTLPSGLALDVSTGVISGTPSAAGTFSFTVQATDALTSTATKSYSLTIFDPIAISTSSLPDGIISTPYTQAITATGGQSPYLWSVSSGALPGGLSLNISTGAISGTPYVAGTFSFTVMATGVNGAAATKSLSLTIYSPLSITASTLPFGTVGSAYSQTIAATGGNTPYSWIVSSGSLPAGLSLGSSTGTISGTPSAAGSFTFTVQVTDANSSTATRSFSITVYDPLSITTSTLAPGLVGISYNQAITATGGLPPYSRAITSGYVPFGTTFNTLTGVISGTPTSAGTFNFTVWVRDSLGTVTTKAFTITVTHTTTPVRISGTTPVYYSSLQAAYNSAAEGDIIQSQAVVFSENLSLNRAVSVTLKGGYDSGFTTNGGVTTISGSLTISNGTATVENIVIQ